MVTHLEMTTLFQYFNNCSIHTV